MVLLFVFLSVKSTKQYFDSKNYKAATAHIDGEVKVNKIEKQDQFYNDKSKRYYTYKYVFTVDGKDYYGEVNNSEEYYGETFEVLYNPSDPSEFVITADASLPWLMYIFTLGLVVAEAVAFVKLIKD